MGRSLGVNIIRDGLVLYFDGANGKCYPKSGTDLNDIISNIDGTLVNGVGYDTDNLGYFVFDGVDDYIDVPRIVTGKHHLLMYHLY